MSLPFEIIQASERFNRIAKKGGFRIDMALCGPKKGLLKLHNGFNLHIEDLWEDAADANAVYLPALWGNPQQSLKAYLERIKPILTQLNERQSFILTVGTSSSFLAELGMLDGKNATTHWHYLEAFAKQYPKVKLQPNHLITRDKNLYCASTINAIADLTVHMMKRTYGAEIAQLAEAQFSPEIRRDFEDYSMGTAHNDELVLLAQDWLKMRIQQKTSIQQLTAALKVENRTLSRRFKKTLGISPLSYLHQIRLKFAKDLLKTTNLSVQDISDQSGFESCSYFISLFKKHFQCTPKQYQRQVRGKLFNQID